MVLKQLATFVTALALATVTQAFVTQHSTGSSRPTPTQLYAENSRRAFLTTGAAVAAAVIVPPTHPANAVQEAEYRQGVKVDAFNGLIFNYRGNDFNGLDAASIGDEPSISYKDFNDKLRAGEVQSVEFLAPDGDVAYAVFKSDAGKKLRIGEGYPIEQHDGYSSPLFAVRAVKNAGVPYKFVVPSLAKAASTSQ